MLNREGFLKHVLRLFCNSDGKWQRRYFLPHTQMHTELIDPLHMEVMSPDYIVKPYGKVTRALLLPFPTKGC